jgi:predicted alpha-1,2-mannosidase
VAACDTTVAPPSSPTASAPSELTQYVNPFIGTAPGSNGDGGNTFPGAMYPMGMVQWSPDTLSTIPGGYSYLDALIKGFSLTHFSGRGCTVYQDIPFIPYAGGITVSPASSPSLYQSRFSHSSEAAHPGYYSVRLLRSNILVELSATARTGMGRFTYPAAAASMLIDAGGSVNGTSSAGVTILAGSQEITGFATSTVGCGTNHYTVYFAARFDHAFAQYGTWEGFDVRRGATSSNSQHSGAFVTFDTRAGSTIQAQVGISFVSIANAQANLAAEDARFNFESVRGQADAAWNKHLSSIVVQGSSFDEKVAFYTALYHSYIHPNIFSDDNGQYLGFDGKVYALARGQQAQYENIPGWDEYRSLIRLRALLDPVETSDIAQSLVNDAVQGDGHLPRWVQANADSHGMNGDDGSTMIAEAYAFGATHFDSATALSAMIAGQPKIREGLADYLRLGYVAASTTGNSAAITLEYANDDFAIAQFANALGDTQHYQLFLQRSSDWRNLFNLASGYIQPRNSDGSWMAHFNPGSESGFQEGTAAQYSWLVPFDLRGLIAMMGGNRAVVSRLDSFFTRLNDGPNSLYAYLGNEPSFEIPWEYDFAGAPSRAQAVVRRIQLALFGNTPGGLPGNDDGGAMSSWYVFSAIGLYPEITGVGGFVVGSPLFSSVTIRLGNGHLLQISAASASNGHPYVQDLRINSAETSNLWIPWSEVEHGMTLDFALAGAPSTWGSSLTDAPPSFSAGA